MVHTKPTMSMKVAAIVLAILCGIMFTPAIAWTSNANAAAKLKVSPTKATIYVAKTKTITAKGLSKAKLKKVKWTTSKKSVATISKTKGSKTVVKGKKAGTAYITAKYGKMKAKAKITVKKAAKKALKSVTVSNITTSGTAVAAGDILKATVDPSGATVSYQWYVGDTAVEGATEQTFKASADGIVGKTITCKVTGTGNYSGTVASTATSAVTATAITGATMTKDPVVGTEIMVTTAPTNAAATYQWKRDGVAISGATSVTYTPVTADLGTTLTCIVTGINGFTGTATATANAAVKTNIKTVATLTMPTTGPVAGKAFTPTLKQTADATKNFTDATYQWYLDSYDAASTKNVKATGTSNALSITPDAADVGHKLVLVVTATGNYGGTIVSDATSAITVPLTAATVTGTASVGETLTVATTPAAALKTATFQWYRGSTAINGATSKTYVLTSADYNANVFCKVTADGTNYTGSVDSNVTNVSGQATLAVTVTNTDKKTPAVGDTLQANVTPENATSDITYQWYKGAKGFTPGTTNAISGATSATYTPATTDAGSYFACVVTTTNTTAYSSTTGTSTDVLYAAKFNSVTITKSGSYSDYRIGETLTATTDPAAAGAAVATGNAGAVYSWYKDDTTNLIESNKLVTSSPTTGESTTANTYKLKAGDEGHTIFCEVTSNIDAYNGQSVTSAKTTTVHKDLTAVSFGSSATVGTKLTATVDDADGAVTHYTTTDPTKQATDYSNWTIQWYEGDSAATCTTAINGATTNEYTPTAADYGKYIKPVVTGTGAYRATDIAGTALKVDAAALAITDVVSDASNPAKAAVGNTISFTLAPKDATVTYQWYRCSTLPTDVAAAEAGTKIDGATSATYKVTSDDSGYYVACVVTPSKDGAYGTDAALAAFANAIL